MNRHTLHALAQQYSMSARLLTPTWRFIVRLEIGGGWSGFTAEASIARHAAIEACGQLAVPGRCASRDGA
jgi:hypothetical protein